MPRYVKKAGSINGMDLWLGFEIEGPSRDVSEYGFILVDYLRPEVVESMQIAEWTRAAIREEERTRVN